MIVKILLVICMIWCTLQQCKPYYPRMFWNPSSKQINSYIIDMIFMFNTNVSCPYSYIQVYDKDTIFKFRCSQNKLETYNDDKTVEFNTFVQKCYAYIQKKVEIQQFQYRVYGSKTIAGQIAQPSDQFLVQYPTNNLPLKLAVISDWGPIIIKPYKALNDTLDYILEKRVRQRQGGVGNEWRISGLVLNGDYAYQFHSDHCQMYLLFLNQVSRISRFWPLITNTGNHQTMQPKSMYLFENSFVIGRVSATDKIYDRVQTYRFKDRATFVYFDPYLQIYNISTPQIYSTMKNTLQKTLIDARKNFPDQFLIMASHYPVICSQIDPHCRDAIQKMPDLYEWLSTPYEGKGLVDLYIGSHMHQYERIWPFVNNKFMNQSSPYYRGRLVSFVEAVGGVNYFIIEQYYKPQYFSVYSTYNITGMGILTFTGNSIKKEQPFQINYKHIITPKTYEVVDQFVITNKWKQNSEQGSLKASAE